MYARRNWIFGLLAAVMLFAVAFAAIPAKASDGTWKVTVIHGINSRSLGLPKDLPVNITVYKDSAPLAYINDFTFKERFTADLRNQLEQKILNETTVLVYPNTPQKVREYQELVVKGFYLANDSFANYVRTSESLASSLNMEYIDYMDESSSDLLPLNEKLEDHAVQRLLQDAGYEFIHVGSWWGPMRQNKYADADINYCARADMFSEYLLTATMPYTVSAEAGIIDDLTTRQWKRTRFEFEEIAKIPEDERSWGRSSPRKRAPSRSSACPAWPSRATGRSCSS